jgi:hypothetical protein
MSDRERWIVYPLLFLAIGLGLNNHALPDQHDANSAEVDALRCKTLEVLDAQGKPKIKLGTIDGSGLIETAAANGAVMTELGTGAQGGHLTLFDADRQKLVLVGFDGQIIGVAAAFVGGQPVLLNAVPIVIRRPSGAKPNETEKPADSSKSSDSAGEKTDGADTKGVSSGTSDQNSPSSTPVEQK